MRFLVDAQLPKQLARFLTGTGHDALHTLDLPRKNRTPDDEINQVAAAEDRIIVTKDQDFVDSHLLRQEPPKLLLISTGNISNQDLLALFQSNLPAIEASFQASEYVELTLSATIAH